MTAYTEESILSLESLDHIRLRAGMYIGRLGDGSQPEDGIYTLFKEIVDNAIDEFTMGHGHRIDITASDHQICVRDYGRGIPLGKLIECVSKINTGAKYQQGAFHFSLGLNGIGLKAVNALSEHFSVRAVRSQTYRHAQFSRGILLSSTSGETTEPDGTQIIFTPDEKIFPQFCFNHLFLQKQIKQYTYLHPKLEITLNQETFSSTHGFLDLLNEEIEDTPLYTPILLNNEWMSCLLTHTDSPGERYFSFVNGQKTCDGGTHLTAFKEGIVKGINTFFDKTFPSSDIREGIVGCIAIKIENPVFESQTKVKLGNTQIKSDIIQQTKEMLSQALHQQKQSSPILLEKIKLNTKTRKNLQFVKQDLKNKERILSSVYAVITLFTFLLF